MKNAAINPERNFQVKCGQLKFFLFDNNPKIELSYIPAAAFLHNTFLLYSNPNSQKKIAR